MSASREKKQRQGSAASSSAGTGKGKTVGYAALAIVIVIAVVALLVYNSGIVQSRSTAVTVGDRNYTPAQVEFYYYSALSNEYMYSLYGMSQFDSSKDPKEQTYSTDESTGEVTTYYDYFLQKAKDSLVELTALLDAAEKDGFSMTSEGEQNVQENLDNMNQSWAKSGYSSRAAYLRAVYGPYMTYGRYKQCVRNAQLASDYYTSHGDSLTYTDDQIQNYYTEHKDELDTIGYAYLFYKGEAESTTDSDGNTVDPTEEETAAAMAEAKEQADAAAAQWKNGASFDEVSAAYEPSSSNGEASALGTNLSSTYNTWLLDSSRQAGDVTVVEASNGYYVVRFLSRELVADPTVSIRHILIKAETPEDDPATEDVDESQNAPTDEAMQAAKEKAEQIYDEWKNGEATEDSFAALANQYSDDTGSNTNGGLYEEKANGYFVQSFNDWCFDSSRQPGDTGLVENTNSGQYGWHILYFKSFDDPVWKLTARDALKSADVSEWLDGLKSGLEAVDGSGLKYVAK